MNVRAVNATASSQGSAKKQSKQKESYHQGPAEDEVEHEAVLFSRWGFSRRTSASPSETSSSTSISSSSSSSSSYRPSYSPSLAASQSSLGPIPSPLSLSNRPLPSSTPTRPTITENRTSSTSSQPPVPKRITPPTRPSESPTNSLFSPFSLSVDDTPKASGPTLPVAIKYPTGYTRVQTPDGVERFLPSDAPTMERCGRKNYMLQD